MKCGQGERLGVFTLARVFKIRLLRMIRVESGEGGGEDKGVGWGKEGWGRIQFRGCLLPLQLGRLKAEDREPRADAAGGVVDDATLAAAQALRCRVPEALGALVDEACCLRRAQRARTVKRHKDEVVGRAAVVAELVLEVRATRDEVGSATRATVEQRAQTGARLDLRRRLLIEGLLALLLVHEET